MYYIKKIAEMYKGQVIALKGNHEEMFLEWLKRPEEYVNFFIEDKDLITIKTFLCTEETEKIFQEINSRSNLIDISKEIANIIKSKHKELILWLIKLPYYFETENQIFVHAGIEEDAEDLWKLGTPKEYFVNKYPPTTGKFIKDIIAGHIGVSNFTQNGNEIYWDGESHFYIDTIDDNNNENKLIAVLKYNTKNKKYTSYKKNKNSWIEYEIK